MPDDSRAIEGKIKGSWDKAVALPRFTGPEFRALALEAIDRHLANHAATGTTPTEPQLLSWWFRDVSAFLIVEYYCQTHGLTMVDLNRIVDIMADEEEG